MWAGFTPAIVRLARRFPLQRPGWAGTLVLRGVFAIGFSQLDASLDVLLARRLAVLRPPAASLASQYFSVEVRPGRRQRKPAAGSPA